MGGKCQHLLLAAVKDSIFKAPLPFTIENLP